jgi:hypothetical protein
MKQLLGITAVLMLVMIVGCTTNQQVPTNPISKNISTVEDWNTAQIYFKTYGGFINPDYAVREFTINKDKIVFEVKSTSGIVKQHLEKNLTKEQFGKITKVFLDNTYFDFDSKYSMQSTVRIADIGNAQLMVTTNLRNKTVDFIPYYREGLPSEVKAVLESLDPLFAAVQDLPPIQPKRPANETNTSLSTIFISMEPKQCQELAWQKWYSEGHIQFIKEPTEEQLITTYYAQVYNITVSNVKKEITSEVVCEACGVCPSGYRLSAEGSEKYYALFQKEGWAVAMV